MNEESLKKVIEEVMKAQMASFFIERERHYKDHEFITDIRVGVESARAMTCKTAWTVTILSLISLGGWLFRHHIAEIFSLRKP